jgi:hypothetical protein
LVAGLRQDAIVAPLVIDGPLDGRIFRTYVERCLVRTIDRGDIVFMINLPSHTRRYAFRSPAMGLMRASINVAPQLGHGGAVIARDDA